MTSPLRVFLLAGQSNMAGRGRLADVAPIPCPSIRKFWEGTWQPALEPLHRGQPGRDAVGLGMSFAAELRRLHPDWTIGLVPCAFGGTPLARWVKGGDLHKAAVAATRDAVAATPGALLAGLLWHQGENDSRSGEDAASYARRLDRMVADFREKLSSPALPFVAGELGRFVDGLPGYPYASRVNAALRDLPGRVPRCAFVSSEGLGDRGDRLHFDARALRVFGSRYAFAWAGLA